MRYVSRIVDSSESVRFSMLGDEIHFVVVHDTETNKDEIVSIRHLLGMKAIYGVAHIGYSTCIVSHTAYMANLYKYIDFAETSDTKFRSEYYKAADFCSIDGYELHTFSDGFDSHTTISCLMSPDTPELGGSGGSVVSYVPRLLTAPQLCSLYDFLMLLCHSSGINIFRYRTIHLYGNHQCSATVIKLAQTVEAQRFFMKMWLNSRLWRLRHEICKANT